MSSVDVFCEAHIAMKKLLSFEDKLKDVFDKDKEVMDAFANAVLHLLVLRDKLQAHPQKLEDIRMAEWRK